MNFLNTPDENFDHLKDYPFAPLYINLSNGLRMHYLDEGPDSGTIVLLLHGEPSWSYLYRKMIPLYLAKGFRVLAPDLIGFGKSSKPTSYTDYSYQNHIQWIIEWMNQLSLSSINLFCQDWGGLIGLRIFADHPERFQTVTVSNTGLPSASIQMPEAFVHWRNYSQKVDILPVSKILQASTVRTLDSEELLAYEAPFPDKSYQAGAKIFPSLVPITSDDPESANNMKAWEKLSKINVPVLTLFGDSDPITRKGEKPFQAIIPGAKHEDHQLLAGGGHFIQEDCPAEIVDRMSDFISKHS